MRDGRNQILPKRGEAANSRASAPISAYPGAGVTADIWFEKGVGIIREEEIRHGTIGERRSSLPRYEPAAKY